MKNGADQALNYTYDKNGNIETISYGTELKHKYYYDTLNQLIRENDKDRNVTIVYTYDVGGNILNQKEYPYTEGENLPEAVKTTSYTYGNTNWKDQLTAYDGKAISYDAIGNPLTYNGNTYTWQNGRQLAGITNEGNNLTTTYKYNDSGIRTQKTVNGVITTYYLSGSKVIYEKTGNNTIYYSYDEAGGLIGLRYNDTQYYYKKNLQGDIIGILDSNLEEVARYTYDSWGRILSITDKEGQAITDQNHIAHINPYRYRSYRYDSETDLYYLQSRYYNPEWGRFVNFDNYGGQVGKVLSHNGYAYCMNNPINMKDESGNVSISIEGLLIGILIYVVSQSAAESPTTTGIHRDLPTISINRTEKKIPSTVIPITTTNILKDTNRFAKTTTKIKASPDGKNYWEADSKANKIAPLTYKEAKLKVETGKNVLCINQGAAIALLINYPKRIMHRAHKEGYYNHYHLNQNTSCPHIWFEGDIILEQDKIHK